MKKVIREFVRKLAIAQEEFLEYGVLHSKTEDKLILLSSRCTDYCHKVKSLPKIEKQRISKASKRCATLVYGTRQILGEMCKSKFQPLPEVDYESLIPWLESAVHYLNGKVKNHLKWGGFRSLKEAYAIFEKGEFEDTMDNVSFYAGLSDLETRRDGYRAFLRITKIEQKELEELVK